jgi:hypothetical protein
MRDVLVGYGLMLEKFLNGAMSAESFQQTYLERFKNETELDGPLFELLDELFGDVDSFTTDRLLLASSPDFYLDESGLREKVQSAANRLAEMKML